MILNTGIRRKARHLLIEIEEKKPTKLFTLKSPISFGDRFKTKNGQIKPFFPPKAGKASCLFSVQAANSKNYGKFPYIIIIATSAANRVEDRATEHAQFFSA